MSSRTPWYAGPPLLRWLEAVEVATDIEATRPFRLPVQWVNRPDLDFRGFAGTIAAGHIAPGDPVRILPSGRTTTIARIVTAGGDRARAVARRGGHLTLADDVDCSRGDVIAAAGDPPQVADQFEATLVWMAEEELLPGRSYLLKLGTRTVAATVQPPKYQVNVNTLEHVATRTLELNAIGVVSLTTAAPLVFEPYADSRELGGFILIDG